MELDGRHAFSLTVRAGGSLRLQTPPLPTYTYQDGVLRRTTWVTRGEGLGGRVGGARLVLGDHPVADELRELGLPRRALMTGSVERVTATFGPAEVIRSTRE
jgi:hypothetical protein